MLEFLQFAPQVFLDFGKKGSKTYIWLLLFGEHREYKGRVSYDGCSYIQGMANKYLDLLHNTQFILPVPPASLVRFRLRRNKKQVK